MAQIADVIKYEGDNTTFIWKSPLEDFNSMTQLIVHESQEAIFFMNGQALDLFGPGRYTLETQNVPKLGKFLNRVTGDQTPFHCEVYFINKTEQMAIKWGTDSKVGYMDPQYGFQLSIGACGEMALQASDSRKLLLKLVGTENYLSQARLVDYFRAFLMTRVKSYIAQTMRTQKINIFEVDEHLSEFSEALRILLIPDFEEYGVSLKKFFVTSVLKPDGEPQYEKFKELHFRAYADIRDAQIQQNVELIKAQTKAQQTIIESQGMATKRAQEGYTYQQERGFDVMGDVARNEGSGSDLRNAAMGIGMGFGVGGAFGSAVNNIANQTMGGLMEPVGGTINTPASSVQNEPDIPGMIHLKTDQAEQSSPVNLEKESNIDNATTETDDLSKFKKRLEKLNLMKEAGLLTDEEFTAQKNRLLSEL